MFITTSRKTITTMFTKYIKILLIQVLTSIYQISKDINLIEKHIPLCMTLYLLKYIVYSMLTCCIVCTCIKWAHFSVYKKIKKYSYQQIEQDTLVYTYTTTPHPQPRLAGVYKNTYDTISLLLLIQVIGSESVYLVESKYVNLQEGSFCRMTHR